MTDAVFTTDRLAGAIVNVSAKSLTEEDKSSSAEALKTGDAISASPESASVQVATALKTAGEAGQVRGTSSDVCRFSQRTTFQAYSRHASNSQLPTTTNMVPLRSARFKDSSFQKSFLLAGAIAHRCLQVVAFCWPVSCCAWDCDADLTQYLE